VIVSRRPGGPGPIFQTTLPLSSTATGSAEWPPVLEPISRGVLNAFAGMTIERVLVHILAARCVRGLCHLSPSSIDRGRREDRVRAAPAVSCGTCTKIDAHEHTGSAEAIRPSLRNGFTAYFVISPVTGFLATVTSQDSSRKAWRQHRGARTTRLRRPRQSRSSVVTSASTASHRTFVTIASRPSCRVRRASW